MRKKLLVLIGLLIIISYGFAQEFDCPGHGGLEGKHQAGHMKKLEMLDLSPEQREEIETSRYEVEKKVIPLRAEIQLKHLDMQKEMQADNPNRSKLMNLTGQISNLQLKIKQLMLDQKLKIHSILTPEQREQIHKPMGKRIEKKIIMKHGEEFKH